MPSRGNYRDRCSEYGVPYEEVNRYQVFVDDRHVCWLCGRKCDPLKMVPHVLAPTIDHVVPLSVKGSPGHVRSNCRTAHYSCNASRGNRKPPQPI